MSVRVRFAPSPTGALHIGGIRTALYNFLFAKKMGGTFILRIEDTDRGRHVSGAEAYITDSLEWLGLTPNESSTNPGAFGPYRQSERLDIYRTYADRLISSGLAYYAFDKPEQLDVLRKEAEGKGGAFLYGALNRDSLDNSLNITEEELHSRLETGETYTIRLKVMPNDIISFEDIVRGEVSFNSNDLDDKILIKADGFPTYHMANVIDDYSMQITHVIRGEEWLSSTAHHLLLYHALGLENSIPRFAHLPLILKPSGNGKLSKRDGQKFGFPVFPISWYEDGKESFEGFREAGFLPQALLNFLVLLGWHPEGDQEILTIDNMIAQFSLERIGKSGARFDYDKAKWFNHQYIVHSPTDALLPEVSAELSKHGIQLTQKQVVDLIELMKERCTVIGDFHQQCGYLFAPIQDFDEIMLNKKWSDHSEAMMNTVIELIDSILPFEASEIEAQIKSHMEMNAISPGNLFPLLRIALTGTTKGPDLFKTIAFLGKEESSSRINHLITIKTIANE